MKRRKFFGRVIAFAMSLAIFGADCSSIPAMAAVPATGIESETDASFDNVVDEVSQTDEADVSTDEIEVSSEQIEDVDLVNEDVSDSLGEAADESISVETDIADEAGDLGENDIAELTEEEVVSDAALAEEEISVDTHVFKEYYTESNKFDFFMEVNAPQLVNNNCYIWVTIDDETYSRAFYYNNSSNKWQVAAVEDINIAEENLNKKINISWKIANMYYSYWNAREATVYAEGESEIVVKKESYSQKGYVEAGAFEYYPDRVMIPKEVYDKYAQWGADSPRMQYLYLKNGNQIVAACDFTSYKDYYYYCGSEVDSRYRGEVYGNFYNLPNTRCYLTSTKFDFIKYPTVGSLDLYIKDSNGEETLLYEDFLKVISKGSCVVNRISIVTYSYSSSSFEDNNKYLYISIDGKNIDIDKLHPEFTDKDSKGNALLEYVGPIKEISDADKMQAVYKFKKSDELMNINSDNIRLEAILVTAPGYTCNDSRYTTEVVYYDYSTNFSETYYDYKNNRLEAKVAEAKDLNTVYDIYVFETSDSGSFEDGQFVIYDHRDEETYENIYRYVDPIATAKGIKINNEMILGAQLKDVNDKLFIPVYNRAYKIFVVDRNSDESSQIVHGTLYNYYNYDSASTGAATTSTLSVSFYDSPIRILEGKKAELRVYSNAAGKISVFDSTGNEVVAGKSISASSSSQTITLATEKLVAGRYTVNFVSSDSTKKGTRTAVLQVYPKNTFFMGSNPQWLDRDDDGNLSISIYSPSTYAEGGSTADDWRITIEDAMHTVIYQGKPSSVKNPTYTDGYMSMMVPVPEGAEKTLYKEYTGLYAKVERTYDNGETYQLPRYEFSVGEGLRSYYNDPSYSYYKSSDAHGQYGEFRPASRYKYGISQDSRNVDLNKHGYYGWYTDAPNAKLAVYQYKTVNKLAEINFGNNISEVYKNLPYAVVLSDKLIQEKGLSTKKVYDFKILDENGECLWGHFTGYPVAAPDGTAAAPVAPTSIKFANTDFYMAPNGTKWLLDYVPTPLNAYVTPSYTSSKPEIVEVVDGKYLVPKKVGDSVITLKTQNGKTATCTVHVGELRAVAGELKDEYALNVGETLKLTCTDGTHLFPVEWITSDSNVATVNNGYITVVGKGNATITVYIGDEKFDIQIEGTEFVSSMKWNPNIPVMNVGDELDYLARPVLYPTSFEYSEEVRNSITFSSDNGEVVSIVDASIGSLKAKGVGTATITATLPAEYTASGEALSSSVQVLVTDASFTVYALTAMDKTLADVEDQLPKGWKFAYPAVAVSSLSQKGQQVSIVNADGTSYATVTVKPVSLSLELITENGDAVPSVVTMQDVIRLLIGLADKSMSDDVRRLTMAGYKFEPLIEAANATSKEVIEFGPDDEFSRLYLKKAGKATIKYGLVVSKSEKAGLVSGNTVSDSEKTVTIAGTPVTITVVDTTAKGIADIKVKVVTENAEGELTVALFDEEAELYGVSQSDKIYLLNETEPYTSTGSNAITYTTSDVAVAKIGKTTGNKTPVTAVSTGLVTIKTSAKDSVGTSGTVSLLVLPRVVDGKTVYDSKNVVLDKYSATININKVENYDEVELLVVDGAMPQTVKAYNKDGSENNHFVFETDENIIRIKASEETQLKAAKKAVTESIYLRVTLNDEDNSEVKITTPVKVTVKSGWPKVTIKQIEKLNTTLAGSFAETIISAPGASISNVSVAEESKYTFREDLADMNHSSVSMYVCLKEGVTASEAKSVKVPVTIDFAGYKNPYTTVFSVATTSSTLELTSTSGTIYLGTNEVVTTQIRNKSTKEIFDLAGITEEDIVVSDAAYKVKIDEASNSLVISTDSPLAKGKSKKISITIKTKQMQFGKKFYYTVKYAAPTSIALQLANPKFTLYKYEDMGDSYTTMLSLKGNAPSEELMDKVIVVPGSTTKNAAEYDKILLETTIIDGKIAATFAIDDSLNIKAGTYYYTFKLPKAYTGAKKDATTKVTITVKSAAGKTKPVVKTTVKGKLDVFNPDSYMTVTPKFTNVNLKDTNISATLNGRDAHLFDLSEDGKKLTIAEGADLVAKYKYSVYVTYELTREDGFELVLDSNLMSVTVTQTNPKVTMTSSSNIFKVIGVSSNEINVELKDARGKAVDIEKLEVISTNPAFIADTSDMNSIKITHNPFKGTTAKGKTYKITIKVYPENYLTNVKPISVTYSVTIAK